MAFGRSLLASSAFSTLAMVVLVTGVVNGRNTNTIVTVPSANVLPHVNDPVQLSDGDLVFRAGRDMMSKIVLSKGEASQFSHVGIVILRDSDVLVVHAMPNEVGSKGGVLIDTLESFTSKENATDVAFYRMKNLDVSGSKRIRAYLLAQVGKPFDDKFLMSEDDSMYCTELAIKALSVSGQNVAEFVPRTNVMTLTEPVVPPDYLRKSSHIERLSAGTNRERAANNALSTSTWFGK